MKLIQRYRRGSLFIDVLLAIGIASLFAVALAGIAGVSNRTVTAARHETEATALAKESMEQVIAIKNANWDDLKMGNIIINQQAGKLVTINAPYENLPGGYTRAIAINQLPRDANGNITTTGTPKDDTIKVAVTIQWNEHGNPKNIQLVSVLTNWKKS